MNSPTTRPSPLDSFETALLDELRVVVAENAAHASTVTTSPIVRAAPAARRPHVRRWALAGVGAAAAATVGAVVLTTSTANPAFAVSDSGSDAVTVTVNRFEDAAGLKAALAAKGITADVTYLPWGKTCAEGRYTPSTPSTSSGGGVSMTGGIPGVASLTLPKAWGTNGRTAVLETSSLPDGSRALKLAVARGPVGACTVTDAPPLDAPPPAPGAPGTMHSEESTALTKS